MKNPVYHCSNCGYKSGTTQGLIQGKKKGCSSCGNSNFKCPRCGIYMKTRKGTVSKPPPGTPTGSETAVRPMYGADEKQAQAHIAKLHRDRFNNFKETGEIINPATGKALQIGRVKKIRRIK